uniref:Ovule protein n=1 Tax=Meloidogyne hapla TaxID=6305 RepID=A0A1I8BTQ3_MELHA
MMLYHPPEGHNNSSGSVSNASESMVENFSNMSLGKPKPDDISGSSSKANKRAEKKNSSDIKLVPGGGSSSNSKKKGKKPEGQN